MVVMNCGDCALRDPMHYREIESENWQLTASRSLPCYFSISAKPFVMELSLVSKAKTGDLPTWSLISLRYGSLHNFLFDIVWQFLNVYLKLMISGVRNLGPYIECQVRSSLLRCVMCYYNLSGLFCHLILNSAWGYSRSTFCFESFEILVASQIHV